MPTTRKKVIKTVYKDEDDSDQGEDFSDSGSDAKISEVEESSSGEEFEQESIKIPKCTTTKRTKFAKAFINKINRQKSPNIDDSEVPEAPFISVSQLSAADKLLPSVLNLSESDSSDDDMPSTSNKSMHGKKQDVLSQHNIVNKKVKYHDSKETVHVGVPFRLETLSESENEEKAKYNDVWAKNITNNSEEIAIKTYLELEKHKNKIEEAKASILKYTTEVTYTSEVTSKNQGSNVKDLLALGEEVEPNVIKTNKKKKKIKDDSDVEGEDWEEVDDKKAIPQQGLQVTVAIPGYISRERKKIDVEMMIKRKMNRVKKEYQIYMHKVHVLCWIGHGNYVSRVLNDQEIMAAALSLVPSKECYPGERVDMKYLEQIVIWYKDKLTVKQDKNENKFKPKAPPLKEILLDQIKKKVVTSNKYLVYIFISILRALGLQCRLMLNFVTTPLKPPSSELCSLSTKPKIEKDKKQKFPPVNIPKMSIPQVDGVYDTEYELFYEEKLCNIIQLDGSNDELTVTRSTRSRRGVTAKSTEKLENKVSPPKRRKSPNIQNKKASKIENNKNSPETEDISPPKKLKTSPSPGKSLKTYENIKQPESNTSPLKSTRRKPMARTAKNPKPDDNNSVITTENNSPGENLVKGQSHSSKLSLRKSSRGVQTFPAENLDIDKVTNIDKVIEKSCKTDGKKQNKSDIEKLKKNEIVVKSSSKIDSNNQQNTRRTNKSVNGTDQAKVSVNSKDKNKISDDQVTAPKIMINNEEMDSNISKYFKEEPKSESLQKTVQCRKRSHTANPKTLTITSETGTPKTKTRTKSDPGTAVEKSKYFKDSNVDKNTPVPKKPRVARQTKVQEDLEDKLRVSHRELGKAKPKAKNDVTGDLVNIIKKSVKEAKEKSKRGKVKGKHVESDEDSDYLPIQSPIHIDSGSDDFKPTKKSPKPSTSRKIDRRVLSSDQEQLPKNKMDVWCEIFVEELEQWVAIDVLKAKVHCTTDIYNRATHPVCYVVSWDNCNYLKDLTRRYVPHWNTVTRKQRAEPAWWNTAIAPWLGPKTARDREEDEALDRMQLEAPLPKSISEYKNHPLYALKRHLLKFEAIYPPEAATLGFVRGEAVYARDCVYVCRSRDVWLKEAKVVRLGEKPYKIVKARPKWDKLSNKMITDKPLEIFGPWQTQDYEPPVAENGVVPRNAYGNVELFKPCMLPKGTVHIKLPCLNRVAKKLNIDCAPAMTGFDFNGGWSHPVYDGFVVCQEYEELITEAWVKDQEEQERREREKIDSRVYGNWKRLIKGLLIRERLRDKYGFVTPEPEEKKNKGPRFVTKKKR